MVAFTEKIEIFPESLPVPQAVEAGAPLLVDRLEAIEVQTSGTFVATVQLQISLDGENWDNVGAPISATGLTTITNTARFLRANVTAYTSGQPVIKVDGKGFGEK